LGIGIVTGEPVPAGQLMLTHRIPGSWLSGPAWIRVLGKSVNDVFAVFSAHICLTDMQIKYVNDHDMNGEFSVSVSTRGVDSVGRYTVSADNWAAGQVTMTHSISPDATEVGVGRSTSISWSGLCRLECCDTPYDNPTNPTNHTNPTAVFSAHICLTDMQIKYVNDHPITGGFAFDFDATGVRGTVDSLSTTEAFENAGGFAAQFRTPDAPLVVPRPVFAGAGTVSPSNVNLSGQPPWFVAIWQAGQVTMTHRIFAHATEIGAWGTSISWCGLCMLPCCLGSGRVLGRNKAGVDDALEILKWVVGLPNSICGNEPAFNAARVTGGDSPAVDDALEILKWVVGLDSLL
jgi:hypothetical protein